jgi:hypothetical protein
VEQRRVHIKNDDLVQVKPLLRMVGDWRRFLPVMFPPRNMSCYNGMNE